MLTDTTTEGNSKNRLGNVFETSFVERCFVFGFGGVDVRGGDCFGVVFEDCVGNVFDFVEVEIDVGLFIEMRRDDPENAV